MFSGKSRLTSLEELLKEVAETGDLSKRASVGAMDAIGTLAVQMNITLSELEK